MPPENNEFESANDPNQPITANNAENTEADASEGLEEPQKAEDPVVGESPVGAVVGGTQDVVGATSEHDTNSTNGPTNDTNGESASALRTGTDRPATGQAGRHSAQIPVNEPFDSLRQSSGQAAQGKAPRLIPKELWQRAMEVIQGRRRKKLEQVIKLSSEKLKVTNNDVQLLLRVSDATATRYLNQLVKENKLVRVGSGRGSVYKKTSL